LKKILAIIRKDTLMRFSSPVEWLFFLILPLVFTVILAGGTGGSGDARISLVVVDQAHTPLSAQLIAALGKSSSVLPDVEPLDQADQKFSSRQIPAVLLIPAEFDLAHLEQGPIELDLRQLPNDLNAMVAARAINAVTTRISSAVAIANGSVAEAERIRPFTSDTARSDYFNTSLQAAQTQLETAPNRSSVTQGATVEKIDYDPRANSSAGQLITWVFIPLLSISGAFAYERQKGTLRRLLTSPTSRAVFLLGTISGQVLMALVQMLLLVGFGILVMHLRWGSSPGGLAIMLIAAALAAAALGTTLGTFVKSEGQASGISILAGMIMALLGGCWYPLELFPPVIQNAAKILPTTWAMQGLLDLVLRGQGISAILPAAGVLLGFAAIFFTIGILRFRYE
jgi:ABC-2 type transport system permease protein